MRSLADTLSTLLLRLWPHRSQQELLLDLGEHKGWTEANHAEAVDRLSEWLTTELLLTAPDLPGDPADPEDWDILIETLRLPKLAYHAGVGASTTALAPLVGASPKTLANWLSRGLNEKRRDHRWLRFLARLVAGNVRVDALVFHRRSPGVVSEELARRVCAPALDAGDALLLFSLVSLWQRRRPRGEARAARGTALFRRQLPKPVSALSGHILIYPQLHSIVDAAQRFPATGRDLVAIALDAALTEAHLSAHSAHRTELTAPDRSGEDWLVKIEDTLKSARDVLGLEEEAIFTWRIARMRAYRDRRTTPPAPALALSNDYVSLAMAIDAARIDPTSVRLFEPRTPGHFMLLPQARGLKLVP